MDPSFSKYAGVMAKFSLIREAAFDIYKETRLLRKWIQIITESIQINKSRAPSEVFCGGLEFGRSKSLISLKRYSSPQRKNLENS